MEGFFSLTHYDLTFYFCDLLCNIARGHTKTETNTSFYLHSSKVNTLTSNEDAGLMLIK